VSTCVACGHVASAPFKFCPECGAPFARPSPRTEQRKVVTVVFCDVTDSTALGGRLDPESLRRVMARYFETMAGAIERHGGTVEKFIGDAVMAVFGVPVLHEDDALRALRAAEEMRVLLDVLNVELERDYGTTLQVRIGVNTGEVVAGTDERLATGDAVNVAARLEQAAGPGEILLGEETMQLASDSIVAEAVEPLLLKGKDERVPAYRLSSVTGDGPARRLDVAMVGRSRELRLLQEVWGRAVSERACQLFTILGSAGVGKSRLAFEFLDRLEGATVVRGRCLSYGEGITYWPVIEVVKQIQARLPALFEDESVRGPIEALRGSGSVSASGPEIAWAVRRLLEAAAADRAVVCVFDDIHWGEATFLDLVEHIADLSRNAPLLVLSMGRPELLEQRPTWGGGKLNATTVLLEPLDARETDLLVDELLAGLGLAEGLHVQIRDAAEGNPFFCEQMVALLQDSAGSEVVVPPSIQALLAARLDQLGSAERSVLELGSVEGRVFHRGAVEALAPGEEVLERLSSLVRKELVRPDRGHLPGEDAFRFRHLLIRDAAYDGLAKSARAELHERFAEWLEQHGRDLVELDEILGYHLEQAYLYAAQLGPVDERHLALARRAGARLSAAGRRAFTRSDVSAQVNLFGRALALLSPLDTDAELELAYAEAVFLGASPLEAKAAARDAGRRAAERGDRVGELRAQLAELRVGFNLGQGDANSVEAGARAALVEFTAAGDGSALADAWLTIAESYHERGQYGEAAETAGRALEYAEEADDQTAIRQALLLGAVARRFGPTPVDDALRWFDEHRGVAGLEPSLMLFEGTLLAMLGRFEEARAIHRALSVRYEELGMRVFIGTSGQERWAIERLAGDLVSAEREARAGCELLEALGEKAWLSTQACELGAALLALGRDDEAEQWAERGREVGSEDDAITQVMWREVKAVVRARRGELAAAESLAREAIRLVDATDMTEEAGAARLSLAEVLELAGRRDEAAAAIEEAIGYYQEKGVSVMVERAGTRLAELRAPATG
jgi:class 3 adenylate cyclase/tetratricopeptide (TPR) repeat protein